MKKLIHFTAFFLFTVFFLIACSKKDQLGPVVDPPEQNPVAPLSGLLFDELNEAIARFDPLYLQIVYKDKRTREVIQEEASRLLTELNQNPTSPLVQKALIELYHFNTYEEFEKISMIISNNAASIKLKYLNNTTSLSKQQVSIITAARKEFIKTKIHQLEKASQKSSTGLWTDNAAWILDQFHYYSQIGNLEMGLDMDGAVGNECNESCCFELQSCNIAAKNKFLINLMEFSLDGARALIMPGGLIGTIFPVVGTSIGVFGGGLVGGIGGSLVSIQYYYNELKICTFNYKACLERKNNN